MSFRTASLLVAPASLVAFGVAVAAISVFASTPGDVEMLPQQGSGENQLFVPGVVSNAEGSYVSFPTSTPAATPSATPNPTVVGVQDAPDRLFVSTSGDDAGEGTRDDPFETITHALAVAREIEDAEIYVALGSYNEQIAIIEQSGVKLIGGYHAVDWEREPGQVSNVVLPDDAALLIGFSQNVHVEGFFLPSGDPFPDGPLRRSRAAVVVDGSSGVTLKDNDIVAGNGLDGIWGSNGTSGAAGSRGLNGNLSGVCPPTNQGGPGGSGSASGGRGGSGGAIDGANGSDGQSISASVRGGKGGAGGTFPAGGGGRGGNGDDGTANFFPGASGGPVVFFTATGYYEMPDGKDGLSTNRLGGGGGGGGGGGAGEFLFACGGGGGGGGGGGQPAQSDGRGGQAGGASFGIFVRGSEVAVVDSVITTGNGGAGGHGGNGGAGGRGGDSGSGGDNAGDGGNGGRGAQSAPGGGGGGGPSIGIIADDQSQVTRSGNSFELGQPGARGLSGTFAFLVARPPHGAVGLRQEFYQEVAIGLPQPPAPTN